MNIKPSFRRAIRVLAYQSPLHRWLNLGRKKMDGLAWDRKLTGAFSSYLDDTISIAIRDTLIAFLINRHHSAACVLDVGCARGSLCQTLGTATARYVGVDISQVAIDVARLQNAQGEFHSAPLEEFEPTELFDAIVFNEVMYYMDVSAAETQAQRYALSLSEDGFIIVSMKNDPKSKVIFKALSEKLTWKLGVLEQTKPAKSSYRINIDAANPAYLIGVFTRGNP